MYIYIYIFFIIKKKQRNLTPLFQIGNFGKGDIVIRVGAFLETHSFRLKEGKYFVVATGILGRDNPKNDKVTAVIQRQCLLLMAFPEIRQTHCVHSLTSWGNGSWNLIIYGLGWEYIASKRWIAWDFIQQHDVALFLQGERLHRPTLLVSRCFCHAAIHKKTEGVSFSSGSVVNS